MLVADIMSKNVHTVLPSASLMDIQEIFQHKPYHHLLVAENGKLLGVISDRDVLRNASPFVDTEQERKIDREILRRPANEFMSKKLVTVDSGTLIDCASILLLENNISCLPVINDDMEIEGILSWKDILEYQVYGIDKALNEHSSAPEN